MRLADFLARSGKKPKDPVIPCNALHKTDKSFNCYLTPTQAIELSRNLLLKAQFILDEGLDDAAVHVWNTGIGSERLYCGLGEARRSPQRRTRKPDAFTLANLPAPRTTKTAGP